jgi:hypothetical protein
MLRHHSNRVVGPSGCVSPGFPRITSPSEIGRRSCPQVWPSSTDDPLRSTTWHYSMSAAVARAFPTAPAQEPAMRSRAAVQREAATTAALQRLRRLGAGGVPSAGLVSAPSRGASFADAEAVSTPVGPRWGDVMWSQMSLPAKSGNGVGGAWIGRASTYPRLPAGVERDRGVGVRQTAQPCEHRISLRGYFGLRQRHRCG